MEAEWKNKNQWRWEQARRFVHSNRWNQYVPGAHYLPGMILLLFGWLFFTFPKLAALIMGGFSIFAGIMYLFLVHKIRSEMIRMEKMGEQMAQQASQNAERVFTEAEKLSREQDPFGPRG